MNAINRSEAKANCPSLVNRAPNGEETVIAKAGRPMVRLVPRERRTTPRPLGLFARQIGGGDHFADPLPEDLQRAFDGLDP